MTQSVLFERKASREPPMLASSAFQWVRERLFGSVTNSIVTLLCIYILYLIIPPVVQWAVLDANISGQDKSVCQANPDGACWTFIKVRFNQIMFGL
jgi:general L-amino acid transport system permease protein